MHQPLKQTDRYTEMNKKLKNHALILNLSLVMGGTATGNYVIAQDPLNSEQLIEEIVVTARLREESILDIPVSVTSLDGLELERAGITAVDGLIGRVPSLYFSQNNSRQSTADNRALVLRGIGANPVLEPSVGTFLDGVYLPSLGFDLGLLDVQRVEVLRGPQGSLFGRNTEGGAINIITRKPDEKFSGRASVEIDDLFTARASASVSGPLVDGLLYAGLSVGAATTDGYTKNVFLDQDADERDTEAVRLTLRWTPTDATEILMTADSISEDGREQGTAIDTARGETFDIITDFDGDMEEDNAGASLTINHEITDMRFTSITGYRDISSSRAVDFDRMAEGPESTGNFQRTFADQESFSQEFRLASIGNQGFDWIVGVYYYDEEDKYETDIQWPTYFGTPPGSAITSSTQDREGYAVFGQANVAAFDDFVDFTVGLRYSDDEVDGVRFNFIDIPAFAFQRTNPDPNDPLATGEADASYVNVSATLQTVFNVSERFKPYINISQGYKGGGFDRYPTSSSLYLPVDAEETINYEIGAKGELLDGRFTYAVAAYRVDIDELQQPTQIINPDTGLPATSIANAGEAQTQGLEMEALFVVNEMLTIDLSVAYTEAEFEKFIDTDGVDRTNDDIPNVPDLTVGLGADLVVPLNDRVKFVGSASYHYVGDYISGLNTTVDEEFSYDGFDIIDLDAGFRIDERHEVSVFLRNARDEYIVLNQSSGVSPQARVHAPRVYGLRFTTNW